MAAYTTMGIARAWAQAISSSPALQSWAQGLFSASWSISIGTDMRRPPTAQTIPFCVIFPETLTDENRINNQHSLGLLIGIEDDVFAPVNGVEEMRALARLDELWPSVQRVLDMSIPGALLTDFDIDYDIHSFPLVMLSVTATVEQKRPIGSR